MLKLQEVQVDVPCLWSGDSMAVDLPASRAPSGTTFRPVHCSASVACMTEVVLRVWVCTMLCHCRPYLGTFLIWSLTMALPHLVEWNGPPACHTVANASHPSNGCFRSKPRRPRNKPLTKTESDHRRIGIVQANSVRKACVRCTALLVCACGRACLCLGACKKATCVRPCVRARVSAHVRPCVHVRMLRVWTGDATVRAQRKPR